MVARGLSLVAGKQGLLFHYTTQASLVVASLIVEHGL